MSKKKSSPKTPPLNAALPFGGVDSHAHLDSDHFSMDREHVLDLASRCGVAHVGNIFLGPEEYQQGKDLFVAFPGVFFVLGLHPCDGQRCNEDALAAMKAAFLADARLKAVGEIGLDFYWDDCPHDVQRSAFAAQLDMARDLKKPVVIHSREATEATLHILEAKGFKDYPLLWHCFGGTAVEAGRMVDNGWHISIPGPVSYPSNGALREALSVIPRDRLLLETDCPYLAPLEWRGQRNEPAFTVFTARHMAAALGREPEELWLDCGRNAMRFFQL